MRRSRVAAVLLFTALAVAAAWWFGRGQPGAPGEAVPSEPDTGEEAPAPAGAPVLSAAPARLARASPTAVEPAGGPEPPADRAPAPAAPWTIRIELPSPPEATLASLPLRLHLASRDGEVRDLTPPPAEGVAAAEGEPQVEWLRPIDPTAGGTVPAWRVRGLGSGEWLVDAARTERSSAGPGASWGPVLVRVAAEPTETTLPLATSATHGRLRLSATAGGGTPASATFHVSWRGLVLERLSVPDGVSLGRTDPEVAVETWVPAGEDVVVRAVPGDDSLRRRTGSVPARTVRVAAGAVEDVRFEFPPLVPVVLVALGPDGTPVARASYDVWRVDAGARGHVLTQRDSDGAKSLGRVDTSLAPGDYRVLVTEVRPYRPAWRDFHVGSEPGSPAEPGSGGGREADGRLVVHVRLAETGPDASCLLVTAEGLPVAGRGLWLGRLDGPSPESAVTALATTDREGRADFGPVPDGAYLVADYGRSVWRTVRVEDGRMDPFVLRLPPDEPNAGRARLRGRVRGPDGGPVERGLVSLGRLDDWQVYAHYADGRFDLEAPEGEGVLTVHHTWFELDRFAPWSRPVVVEAGKAQSFDVRLSPR